MSLIAWLDLETSGLRPRDDLILEVAVVLTRRDLEPFAEYHAIIRPITADWESLMDPVVHEMHTASGLLAELADQPRRDRIFHPGRSVTIVGTELVDFVTEHRESDDEPVYLGGSGVSHFDRRWLEHWWPRVDRLFHRRTVDVGIVRQYLDLFTEQGAPPNQAQTRPHRALLDVYSIIDEARSYRAVAQMGLDEMGY